MKDIFKARPNDIMVHFKTTFTCEWWNLYQSVVKSENIDQFCRLLHKVTNGQRLIPKPKHFCKINRTKSALEMSENTLLVKDFP